MPVKERQLNTAQLRQLDSRRTELLAALEHAFAPRMIIEALVAVGLTAADLALATGANKRTVTGWVEDAERNPKVKAHRKRLAELKELTWLVVENGTIAYQEADWLRHRNRGAEFKTPLELVGQDEWLEAVRVYCDDVAIPMPPEFRPAEDSSQEPKHTPDSVGAP